MKIILASESFLKNYIFSAANIEYEKMPADIDESVFDHLPVPERVVALTKRKCEETLVQLEGEDAIIISADVLVILDGVAIQKAPTFSDGFSLGMSMSGKEIEIHTGCAIYAPNSGIVTNLTSGKVKYTEFSVGDLNRLAKNDDPRIRNGLGVFTDSPGFTLIERWEGSYTGLMGLPMEFVYKSLKDVGAIPR